MSPSALRLSSRLFLPLSPSPSPLSEAWSRQKNWEIFSPAGRSCKKCASEGGYAPPEVSAGGGGASVRRVCVCTWRPTKSPRTLSRAPRWRSFLGDLMQFSPPSSSVSVCVCECMCVLTSHVLPPPSRQPRAQLQLDERDLKNSFLCRVF